MTLSDEGNFVTSSLNAPLLRDAAGQLLDKNLST